MNNIDNLLTEKTEEGIQTPLLKLIDTYEEYTLKPELINPEIQLYSLNDLRNLDGKVNDIHNNIFKDLHKKKAIATQDYLSNNSSHSIGYELLKARYNLMINLNRAAKFVSLGFLSKFSDDKTRIYLDTPGNLVLINIPRQNYEKHDLFVEELINIYSTKGIETFIALK